MRRPALTAALAAATLTLPSLAHADGVYVSDSIGAGTLGDAFARRMASASMSSTATINRLALGMRAGNWSIEPFIAVGSLDDSPPEDAPSLTSYGLDVKRVMQVSAHLSVYVRGSLSVMSTPDQSCCIAYDGAGALPNDLYGYRGRGLGIGAGAQYTTALPVLGLHGGVFIEDSYDYYRLFPNTQWEGYTRYAVDASITRLSVGLALGSDF